MIAVNHGNGINMTGTSLQSSTQDREVTDYFLACKWTRSEKRALYRFIAHAHQKEEYGYNVHAYTRRDIARNEKMANLVR